MTDHKSHSVVITSTEWRSLLAYGQLKLSRRRIQVLDWPPTRRQGMRLFSWAPGTVLGDGNDVIVLELHHNWRESAQPQSEHPSELVILTLSHVDHHHAVGPQFHSYLVADSEMEGVHLHQGKYNSLWANWVKTQKQTLSLKSCNHLLDTLDLHQDLLAKRHDGYRWSEIMELGANAKLQLRKSPRHVEVLLRNVRTINSAVSATFDTAAYAIATNIEWIKAKMKRDPLKNPRLQPVVSLALAETANTRWSTNFLDHPESVEALTVLLKAYPAAFTDELNPVTVTSLLRLVVEAKERTLEPVTLSEITSQLSNAGHTQSAITATVATAGALGPILTRRLATALKNDSNVMSSWDTD